MYWIVLRFKLGPVAKRVFCFLIQPFQSTDITLVNLRRTPPSHFDALAHTYQIFWSYLHLSHTLASTVNQKKKRGSLLQRVNVDEFFCYCCCCCCCYCCYLALPQLKNQFSGPTENGRRASGLTLADADADAAAVSVSVLPGLGKTCFGEKKRIFNCCFCFSLL